MSNDDELSTVKGKPAASNSSPNAFMSRMSQHK